MKLWRYFLVRLMAGWVLVSILPAFLLFSHFIFSDTVETSLIYSMMASFCAVFFALLGSEYFAKFPVQKSVYLLSSILFIIIGTVFFVFFALRIPYSIYYLTLSMAILVIFCFFSQNFLQSISKQIIGYIPIGRANALVDINSVDWVVLSKQDILEKSRQLNAIVADLSDNKLQGEWAKLLARANIQGTPVYNVVQARELLTGRVAISHLHENDLGSLTPSPVYKIIKRAVDIGLIVLALPIIIPIASMTAIAIKLDSKGDVIFTQERVGLGGKVFTMYKFRSMTANAENQNTVMTQVGDKRITRVGHIIRKLRIDEFPQFWNIIKGDMSLIGPRPELPNMVEKQEQEIPFYIYRQLVKPGLSGWAQVTQGGDHVENIAEKLEYDFYYIKNASLTLDFLIIIKTIQTALTGFGAR